MHSKEKIPVAILGATGVVGQKAIALIDQHPNFKVAELVASKKRAGRCYGDIVTWREEHPLSDSIASIPLTPWQNLQTPYVISALPSNAAAELEPQLTARGHNVFSNASSFRMHHNVPLLIPEINSDHLQLLDRQNTEGKLVTNPNCAAVFITLALSPLMQLGTIEHVSIVTMQAVSGAGYPGESALDTLNNIVPHIPQEENKIAVESCKILGTPSAPATIPMTIHVHRVPVLHGHTVALHVRFSAPVDLEQVKEAYHSEPYQLYDNPYHPQPRQHIGSYDQGVHIGGIKSGGDPRYIGLIAMGHNLVRGAAGASLHNMEAFCELATVGGVR